VHCSSQKLRRSQCSKARTGRLVANASLLISSEASQAKHSAAASAWCSLSHSSIAQNTIAVACLERTPPSDCHVLCALLLPADAATSVSPCFGGCPLTSSSSSPSIEGLLLGSNSPAVCTNIIVIVLHQCMKTRCANSISYLKLVCTAVILQVLHAGAESYQLVRTVHKEACSLYTRIRTHSCDRC
jgi:hypothetical protein